MRSCEQRMPAIALGLLAMLALPGCASGPVIKPIQYACASRVPPQLAEPVAGAALPAEQTVGAWVSFGDAQTSRLEQANDRNGTVLWIVRQCEGEQKSAADDLTRRSAWQRLTPWAE